MHDDLPAHLLRLAGAKVTFHPVEYVTEGLITFTWRGHTFHGDTILGGSWTFSVERPDCPAALLDRVFDHLADYLGRESARRHYPTTRG